MLCVYFKCHLRVTIPSSMLTQRSSSQLSTKFKMIKLMSTKVKMTLMRIKWGVWWPRKMDRERTEATEDSILQLISKLHLGGWGGLVFKSLAYIRRPLTFSSYSYLTNCSFPLFVYFYFWGPPLSSQTNTQRLSLTCECLVLAWLVLASFSNLNGPVPI